MRQAPRRTAPRRLTALGFTAVILATVLAACSGGSSKTAANAGGAASAKNQQPTKAGLTYGYGPVHSPSIQYQGDVVLVDGGPNIIRSASADGLTWTIDGAAPGASQLAVGKVMYATSRAVGRVLAMSHTGSDVVVTLAPVSLTDVFRDAHFQLDRAIDPKDALSLYVPELPAQQSAPASTDIAPAISAGASNAISTAGVTTAGVRVEHGEQVVRLPQIALAAVSKKKLPPVTTTSVNVTVGDWEAEPYYTGKKLGIKVGYKANKSLKVFVDLSFLVSNLRMRADIPISGGKIGGGATVKIDGIQGVSFSASAGAANGSSDNKKIRVEVPVDLTFPVPGEPLVYSNKWKFIVATALGGKNTTVEAAGEWALNGAIGLVDGAVTVPTLKVTKSILQSITGLSIGVSGITFAAETKLQFGLGMPAAFAGPYGKVTFDLGFTNGSALGAALARCVSATLDMKVGMGYGISISSEAIDALKKLFGDKLRLDLDTDYLKSFFSRTAVLPDVPLCRGGV